MTTKNLKTHYGAVGNGQLATATLTIANGFKSLASTTDLWVPGDANKTIAIEGAGTVSGSNPLGALRSTIATVTDAKHIVIADNAETALSAASKRVEWGTDDRAAFNAFVADFQGATGVELDIDAGRYCVVGGSFNTIGLGVKGLIVRGALASPATSIISDLLGVGSGLFFGSMPIGGQHDDKLHSALIDDVTAGAKFLPFLNSGNAALFAENTFARMTGFEVQDFHGAPSNPYYCETVFITGVSGTGITIAEPLRYSYRKAWPNYFSGVGGVDGGPAMLYALDQRWDCQHEYIDIGDEQQNVQTNLDGRDITMTRGYAFAAIPSQNLNFTATDWTNQNQMEIDKLVENVTINRGTYRGFNCQQATPDLWTMTGATVTDIMNGTGKKFVATDCLFPAGSSFGPHSYSVCETVICTRCDFPSIDFNTSGADDVLGAGGFTFHSGGTLTRSYSGGAPTWARPKGYVVVEANGARCYAFRVNDVVGDGTAITVSTTLPDNWLSLFPNSGTVKFRGHPCQQLTFKACTGCDTALAFSNVVAGQPWGENWNLTYTGNIGTSNPVIPVLGKVRLIKVTVNTVYSTGTLNFDGPFVINQSAGTKVQWFPSFDLTQLGARVITPSGVTGAAGSDANLTLPNANTWLLDNQITPKMTGATGSGNVTLEIYTDQGVTEKVLECQFG